MTKISVIMPVYNSQEYVSEAIGSVLAQDFDDFELLVMDDGSWDGSGAICDSFAREDPRVSVFHLENGGMCRARNVAMKHARGEYIAFCDNDDYYLPGLLADAYQAAKRWDADCVCYGRTLRQVSDAGEVMGESQAVPAEEACLEGDEIYRNYRMLCYGTDGVWARVYRRAFLRQHGITFDEAYRNGVEDLLFNLQVADHARRIGMIPRVYYVWVRRETHSASMEVNENRLAATRMDAQSAHDFMVRHGIDESDPAIYAKRMLTSFLSATMNVTQRKHVSYQQERAMYERLRNIYQPYAQRILSCPLDVKAKTMFKLVSGGHYAAAYVVMRQGSRMLGAFRKAAGRGKIS